MRKRTRNVEEGDVEKESLGWQIEEEKKEENREWGEVEREGKIETNR